jgi:hypothetical protein
MHCQGTEVNHNGSISGTLALKFSGYVGVNVDDTYRGKPFLSLPERVICVKSIGLLHLGHSCALENRKRKAPIKERISSCQLRRALTRMEDSRQK